jgi:hypothetical protein
VIPVLKSHSLLGLSGRDFPDHTESKPLSVSIFNIMKKNAKMATVVA